MSRPFAHLPSPILAVALTGIIGMGPLHPVAAAAVPDRSSPPAAGDELRGRRVYQAHCGWCHSIDANGFGPSHRGLFGRRSGGAPGYRYSAALKATETVWSAATLDVWLKNPPAMIAGTTMTVRLPAPQDRADVIAYLRKATEGARP